MDVGGIDACKKFYDKAGAKYVTLVDSQNALSDAFGFKVVPNGFLIDEAAVLRGVTLGGFNVKSPRTIQAVEEFLALSPATKHGAKPGSDEIRIAELKAAIAENADDAEAKFELGRLYLRLGKSAEAREHLEFAAGSKPPRAAYLFTLGSLELAEKNKDVALKLFKSALALDRGNYLIRKQIWMVEHPERFFPEIDWAWQSEQLRKERAAEGGGGGGS